MSKHYAVYTRVWKKLDQASGEWEIGRAYAETAATSRREAQVLAVRQWRRKNSGIGYLYILACADDHRSPFTGLIVKLLPESEEADHA